MRCKRTFKVFAKIGFKKIFSLILSLCLFLVNTVFSRSSGNCYTIVGKEIAQETNNSERIRIRGQLVEGLAAGLPLQQINNDVDANDEEEDVDANGEEEDVDANGEEIEQFAGELGNEIGEELGYNAREIEQFADKSGDSSYEELSDQEMIEEDFRYVLYKSRLENIKNMEKNLPPGSVDCEYLKILKAKDNTISIIGLADYMDSKEITIPDAFIFNENGEFSFPKGEIDFNGESFVSSEEEDGKICPVVSIHDYAFVNLIFLTEVVLPKFIKTIGRNSFSTCNFLKQINLPNSIEHIGESAFSFCISLTAIELPSNIKTIEEKLFYFCKKLTFINLPPSVEFIGEKAFYNCFLLEYIDLSNVKGIEKGAFSNCVSLKEVVLSKIIFIKKGVFGSCENMTKVVLSDSLESIGLGAFFECKSLESLHLPDTVSSIGPYAFGLCYSLKSINLPNCLERIRSGTFRQCENLSEFEFPPKITYIGKFAFFACKSLKRDLVFPKLLESIGKCAFSYSNLTSLRLSDSVVSIGNLAFYECLDLIAIVWPSFINFLGDEAFGGCPKLVLVLCNRKVPVAVESLNKYAEKTFFNGNETNELVVFFYDPDDKKNFERKTLTLRQ
ncbi:MAG: leucine-rich repeat domain-containing protein [Oscillospiraceae bacterium]|jgi:hypothetical protein|nr:leucine-rich repeat domain-containing protein [Oscillospiraceae bacterium]